MVAVGSIHAFLVHNPHRRAGRGVIAQFEPVNARVVRAHIHGVVGEQSEVARGQHAERGPIHQPVGDGIQVSTTRLRDAVAGETAHVGVHVRGGDHVVGVIVGVEAEGAVAGIRPIHHEFPDAQGIGGVAQPGRIIPFDEDARRARGRRVAVQVGRQHTAIVQRDRADIHIDHRGRRITQQHFVALEGHHAGAGPAEGRRVKLIDAHVVGVGPDAELRIVVHQGVAVEVIVQIPAARRVSGLGYGNTLMELRGAEVQRELAVNPALGQVVEQHDGVAIVVGLTNAAETRPQAVAGHRPHDQRGVGQIGHIPDSQLQIHGLDIILGPRGRVVADVARGVRRQHTGQIVIAVEGGQRRGHSRGHRPQGRLHHGGVGRATFARGVQRFGQNKIGLLERAARLRGGNRIHRGRLRQLRQRGPSFASTDRVNHLHAHGHGLLGWLLGRLGRLNGDKARTGPRPGGHQQGRHTYHPPDSFVGLHTKSLLVSRHLRECRTQLARHPVTKTIGVRPCYHTIHTSYS